MIPEVRDHFYDSTVNNDCSRLDIKGTLIQYREEERERRQSGPNSLKGVLAYVTGDAYSISQQKARTAH